MHFPQPKGLLLESSWGWLVGFPVLLGLHLLWAMAPKEQAWLCPKPKCGYHNILCRQGCKRCGESRPGPKSVTLIPWDKVPGHGDYAAASGTKDAPWRRDTSRESSADAKPSRRGKSRDGRGRRRDKSADQRPRGLPSDALGDRVAALRVHLDDGPAANRGEGGGQKSLNVRDLLGLSDVDLRRRLEDAESGQASTRTPLLEKPVDAAAARHRRSEKAFQSAMDLWAAASEVVDECRSRAEEAASELAVSEEEFRNETLKLAKAVGDQHLAERRDAMRTEETQLVRVEDDEVVLDVSALLKAKVRFKVRLGPAFDLTGLDVRDHDVEELAAVRSGLEANLRKSVMTTLGPMADEVEKAREMEVEEEKKHEAMIARVQSKRRRGPDGDGVAVQASDTAPAAAASAVAKPAVVKPDPPPPPPLTKPPAVAGLAPPPKPKPGGGPACHHCAAVQVRDRARGDGRDPRHCGTRAPAQP